MRLFLVTLAFISVLFFLIMILADIGNFTPRR